ncbi:MAG TPA: hypothetical protein VF427_05770 [Noviherbaspirillum sp.]
MELTIIGLYEEQYNACSAKYDLLASGFSRSKVQLNPDDEFSETEISPIPRQKSASLGASIGNFFTSLLSVHDKSTYSNIYAEAVKRGNFVLTVDVASDDERARATEIMARHSPVEMEERSADWVRHGWRGHNPEASAQTGVSVRHKKETGG